MELSWWMTNGSALSSLVMLEINGSGKFTQIKSFGELSSLKELTIRKMTSLSHIGEDQEAATSRGVEAIVALYPSLKKLTLDIMPNLEEWLESDGFPHLEVLSLTNCPNLRKTPHLFPALKWLNLNDVSGMGVRSITNNLTSLTSFSVRRSEDLTLLSSVELILGKNKLLQTLEITSCPNLKIDAIPFSRLGIMNIYRIKDLAVDDSWANNMGSLTELEINDIPELTELPVELLQNCKHLQKVRISDCPKFQGFISSNKERGVEQALHHTSSSLEVLHLRDCPDVLPLGLPLQGFLRLRELHVCGCTRIKSWEVLQFLSNIQQLTIGLFSEELDCFPFLDAIKMNHLVSSLCELCLYGWSNLKSLPDQLQHLCALKLLIIRDFDGMMDLSEWLGKFTSLETLSIYNCKNLLHLPSAKEMQLLMSLRKLHIFRCPLLKERCRDKKRGDSEWHKISHIPYVSIDFLVI